MDTGTVSLRSIASGSQDAAITTWAQQAAAYGHPFFLRLNWEMNGGWFSWGTTSSNQNTPADYVAAWRHVHQIFVNAGATNVKWVWCPNIDPYNAMTKVSRLYPGKDYVDWTCLDGYNFGTPWTSFRELYESSYDRIMKLAPSKPMLIGEVASTERNGSKAAWIGSMFSALAKRFHHIHGLVWYDVKGSGGHPKDWPIESSKTSSAAFRKGIGRTLARICRGLGGAAKANCLGVPTSGEVAGP
jgi:hypothetical protein